MALRGSNIVTRVSSATTPAWPVRLGQRNTNVCSRHGNVAEHPLLIVIAIVTELDIFVFTEGGALAVSTIFLDRKHYRRFVVHLLMCVSVVTHGQARACAGRCAWPLVHVLGAAHDQLVGHLHFRKRPMAVFVRRASRLQIRVICP